MNRLCLSLLLVAFGTGCTMDLSTADMNSMDPYSREANPPATGADTGSTGPVDPQGDGTLNENGADGGVNNPSVADGSMQADASGTSLVPEDPNHLDQRALFQCDGRPTSSPPRIRRMERKEITYTMSRPMTSLISGSTMRHNPMMAPAHLPFSTYSKDVSVDVMGLDMYLGVHAAGWNAWAYRHYHGIHRITANGSYDVSLACILPVYREASATRPDAECIDNYVRELLERGVLNRPATDEEYLALRSFAGSVFEAEDDPFRGRADSLQEIATAAWLTTGALFRDELGDPALAADGRMPLTTWELAKAVAYTLDDRAGGVSATRMRITDDDGNRLYSEPSGTYLKAIRDAADDESIHQPETLSQLVRQYAAGIDEDRMDLSLDYTGSKLKSRSAYWVSNKIRRFFREWLGYEKVRTVFKDTPWATTAYADADRVMNYRLNGAYAYMTASSVQSAMHEPDFVHQLDDTIARIIVEDTDVLGQLLTSRRFYLPSSHDPRWDNADDPERDPSAHIIDPMSQVSKIYGFEGDIGFGRDERWTELAEGLRAGVLTHPGWLAAHGGNFEDDGSLIERGHWIRENLLCEDVPGLELVTVDAQLVPRDPALRARDRIADSIEDKPECMGCHSLMNSLGKPFEIFNHAGILRAEDHGQEPDGSSVLEFMPEAGLNGRVNDAIELTERLARSPHVKRCFIRQTFRFFMGRNERPADACTLSAMEATYDESGGSFIGMLETLVTSGTFLYRTQADQE